ncbi:MAG: T9SS type A sorting domain-containing protein [Candidatus Kapabacteria bacterium]|nr:T9SS type A sorting domain-containing protein [Candidatus Kapabacteria bacterium]
MVQRYLLPTIARVVGLLALVAAFLVTDVSAQYCTPTVPAGWGNYGSLQRVVVGSMDYTAPPCANCVEFTGVNVDLLRQVPTAFRVEPQNGSTTSFLCTIFIDINQDGVWQNPAERFAQGYATANFVYTGVDFVWQNNPFTGNLTLPCTALLGQTRMRVKMNYSVGGVTGDGPCDPFLGSVWDFNATIGGDIVSSFPDDVSDDVALLDKIMYDGVTNVNRPRLTMRVGSSGQRFNVTYRIAGPQPLTTTVYEGHTPGSPAQTTFTVTGPTGGTYPRTFTFDIPAAKGSLALPDGSLDARNALGGEYQLLVTAQSTAGCFSEWYKSFNIAEQRDMSARQIRSPRDNNPPSRFKYPNTVGIPVEGIFQNTGKLNVEEFNAIAEITAPDGTISYRDTVNLVETLLPRQRSTVTFRNYTAVGAMGHQVGLHKLKLCAKLINPFPDDAPFNDCSPRAGQLDYVFEVGYNEEVGVESVTVPAQNATIIAGRPFRPEGVFFNGGIQDLTNVPVRLVIKKLPQGTIVYNRTGVIPDIGAGQFNKAIWVFDAFTPNDGGDYEFCFRVEYPGDPQPNNNEICVVRSVIGNLNGTYTIGTLNAGKPRNFPTWQAALDSLYFAGVSGPVVFELTDQNYLVESTTLPAPAIDLSSRILGMSATNNITFKPSLERSLSRASVTVRMRSGSGVGVLFGQNSTPSNPKAIQNQLYFSTPANANSAGYITFDGGTQKSLRFTIERSVSTPSPFLSAFYLGTGSQNIVIKNLLIEHSSFVTPTYATSLPLARYNGGSQEFRFDNNTVNTNQSFTAGITNRDTVAQFNLAGLDTVVNVNNTFSGNEISGFGYGVVSMGLGVLIKAGLNEFRPYYNTGTKIENNTIYNVRRAGIWVGYEDGASIVGNRVYNVGVAATGGTVTDAAGIIAGGETRYNNMNLMIARNEVSGIRGNSWSRGIVVEQVRNDFTSILQAGGIIAFPNEQEHSRVFSNAVWGLSRAASNGNMAGIHLLTRRGTSADPVTALLTANISTYFTRGDTIANNTVLISGDNFSNGTGAIVGIGTQHGNGTVVVNNAIAITAAANQATLTQSALLYEGTIFRGTQTNTDYLPTTAPAALVSNRNAFWTPNSGIARFIEISDATEIVSSGSQDEFTTIDQWRNWTAQDINSVYGNFTTEHVFGGVAPKQTLRVKVTPQPPIGSILNNRGQRVNGMTVDIDGGLRGEAGTGFDIGADEFNGRSYVSDLDVVDILSPAAYRRTTGTTSDAEYIMTQAPIDVKARVRNNGALSQTNAKIRVRIFMETAQSNNAPSSTPTFNAFPAVDRTVSANFASGEIKDILFGIRNFTPQTYFALFNYTVPARFASMTANVTPLYRIEVSVPSDEFTPNNTYSKIVRFYLAKSNMRMVVSARGSSTDITSGTPTTNQIAGRLNADSLRKSMADLGWINDPASGEQMYDIFERGAWEDRAVNYSMYRTMFWSHDESAMTRTERDDIRNFLNAGSMAEKKNLAIGSQEIPRRHIGLNIANDEIFVRKLLRARNVSPGTPVPPPTNSYHGRRITGTTLARNSSETIQRTGFLGDNDPVPALISIYSDATTTGIANAAYIYRRGDRTTTDSIMGTAVAGLNSNLVYLGIDWRHYARTAALTGGERVLRGIVDFFYANGGIVVPVELTSFDAKARGSNVDVFWSTASEKNSDRFVVERASVTDAGTSDFAQVSTLPAAGNSTERRDYRMTDENVATGSYLYRLTSVDKDGSSTTSTEVMVTIEGEQSGLWIGEVSPNPVVSAASVTFGQSVAGDVELKLFSVSGQEIATIFTGMLNGSETVNMTTANIPAGSYTLVLRSGGMVATKTVTVVK